MKIRMNTVGSEVCCVLSLTGCVTLGKMLASLCRFLMRKLRAEAGVSVCSGVPMQTECVLVGGAEGTLSHLCQDAPTPPTCAPVRASL